MKLIKNIKKNTIFLLIITIIILYIILKDDFSSIINELRLIDLKYIFIALIFFLLSISIKGYVNYLIVHDKKKINLKEAIKHNFIAQFFNGITPFATGGQPMEVYMLTEHGISLAKATTQTMQSFIFYPIALVICGIFAVGYNLIFHIFPKIRLLQHLLLLGFLVNIMVVVVLLLISYSKKITRKINSICNKVIRKLKLKISEEELKKKFDDYYNSFKELRKNRNLFIAGIMLNIVSLACLYIIPLMILYSMHDFTSMSAIEVFTATAYVYVIASFVPIPGGSGGIEYGFTQFYGNFISGSIVSAILLIWRFITYYLAIIIGATLFNIDRKEKK